MKRRFLLPISVLLWLPALTHSAPVQLTDQAPATITKVAPGITLIDFGKVAFGNLMFTPPANASNTITVHFGEDLSGGRINRHPPGSVRYAVVEAVLDGGKAVCVAPAPDKRNTVQPMAALTPPEWGVVLPFRWVEVENWPGEMRPEQIHRRAAFASAWNDQASAFETSDMMLNRVWDLCHYSIKATTFAGVYVDGDRERIPYEADAYLSQLGRYYSDGDIQMARETFDRLLQHPTWPSEWAPHMVFMAYADWMQTGDTNWLAAHYAALKSKLQFDRALPDGLIGSTDAQIEKGDVVDWPQVERDGFVFTHVNTVVNAFHLRALRLMSELARALNQTADADKYAASERTALAAFQKNFFDPVRGLYRDGEGTDHCSMHASLFPLAFGLVPARQRAHIAQWLGDSGMKCSVYAAQYLLAGLFENGETTQAIALMTAPGDRSWRHMVESGTTITWEAWDQRFKTNQDWNHAWGAAPANLLPQFVLGAEPLTPGWTNALIQPHPGLLEQAKGKIPTPLGPISIEWKNSGNFKLLLALPPQMSAQVDVPAPDHSTGVVVNGEPVRAKRDGQWWVLKKHLTGSAVIEVQ